VAEQTVIALSVRHRRVFKLTGAGQHALQGHMIALPHDAPHELAPHLPRTNLSGFLRVAFVANMQLWNAAAGNPVARLQLMERFRMVLSVNAGHVFMWLRVLRVVNPYYHDVSMLNEDDATISALHAIPDALLDEALPCTSDVAQRLEAHAVSRADGDAAPVGGVFVAPPVRANRGDAQTLEAIRAAVTDRTHCYSSALLYTQSRNRG
jgi:hypothetical protein